MSLKHEEKRNIFEGLKDKMAEPKTLAPAREKTVQNVKPQRVPAQANTVPVASTAPIAPEPEQAPVQTSVPIQRTVLTGAYTGMPAHIAASKKECAKLLTDTQMIHLTPEQKAEVKLQIAAYGKAPDLSSLFRTAADIILEMDSDMYARIREAAVNEQVSVATIINRALARAGV